MLAVDKVTTTRFLSYAHAKDVLPTIKRVLSPRGDIVADERTNGLVITDIPTVIAQVDKLLAQLDRKTQEVEIEARVIAATRSFARDIGTQFGFGWGNNPTSVGGGSGTESPNQVGYYSAPPYFTSPVVSGSSTTATPASIPLFSNLPATSPTSGISLLNLGSAYRVDSVLTAAEQRGLLKVLSRPRVITQNNIQAVIKQGQRVPITTLGQLNGPPTVTYIDAVLRLTVTPQITVENTIFLNVDIENTTPDYSNEIQGNPVFLTQQATTQVLVTNGGTVVIGGVLQTSNSYTIQQVPFLGSVPMLGNLFKRRAVNTSTQELIFFITPRILET
jgi:type IV pilus assembly protein PilQ